MSATGLPRSILVLLAALTALGVSLLASGAWLLLSPQSTDSASTAIAAACLATVGALIVLTRATLRGSRPAWLLSCAVSGLVLVASAVAGAYALAGQLRPPPGVRVGDAMVRVATDPTLIEAAGNASPLIIAGAAWAVAVLVRPRTRTDLRGQAWVKR